jgi:eukaryotic-like serine/threonine-protein kinase
MTDPAMGATERCGRCDAEFVPDASPLGLCPACLLKLGASDPAMKMPPAEAEPVLSHAGGPVPAPPPRRRRSGVLLATVATCVVAALAGFYFMRRSVGPAPAPGSRVIRFTLPLPGETDPAAGEGAQFAVSPDATRIALAAASADGQTRLWVRTLQSMEWRALPRTEGAALPFWSPDSRHIGFFAEKKLKRIDVSNGLTQTLCEAASARGAGWSREGTIVFAPTAAGPLFRVADTGGTPGAATTLDESRAETAHAWPHVLPNGNVLFVVTAAGDSEKGAAAQPRGAGSAGLHFVSFESGRRTLLVPGAGAGAFAQGFLLYVREARLVARRFDPGRGDLLGDEQAISGAEHVAAPFLRGPGFAASEAGLLVHRAESLSRSQLTWIDRRGRVVGVVSEPADYQQFSISPDGRRVAAARRNAADMTSSIWLIEPGRDVASRLTVGASHDASPLWLPGDHQLLFASLREGGHAVYAIDTDGGASPQLLQKLSETARLEDVSPDGRFLVYSSTAADTGLDVRLLPLDGDRDKAPRKPLPLLQTAFDESGGRVSPDGRWIAYVSDESGRDEVYVRPFPTADSRWQISSAGGRRPRWRRDGRELFFASPERFLIAVDVQGDSPFRSGAPRTLFQLRHHDEYEVTGDGQLFLTKSPVEEDEPSGLQIVLNWQEELKRLVPPR